MREFNTRHEHSTTTREFNNRHEHITTLRGDMNILKIRGFYTRHRHITTMREFNTRHKHITTICVLNKRHVLQQCGNSIRDMNILQQYGY